MSVQSTIEAALVEALEPSHVEVVNESNMHSVPPDSETHFCVTVVSERFAGQRSVARHQRVYQLLGEQLRGGVHALALHTYTPQEWESRQRQVPGSPQCLGGSRADHS